MLAYGACRQVRPIVDAADYFKHVKAAMLRARRRIMLIGWDFDSRVTFERGRKTLPGPNQLGTFLYWMLWKRPGLDIYLLKSICVCSRPSMASGMGLPRYRW